jgi:hypothetical protein
MVLIANSHGAVTICPTWSIARTQLPRRCNRPIRRARGPGYPRPGQLDELSLERPGIADINSFGEHAPNVWGSRSRELHVFEKGSSTTKWPGACEPARSRPRGGCGEADEAKEPGRIHAGRSGYLPPISPPAWQSTWTRVTEDDGSDTDLLGPAATGFDSWLRSPSRWTPHLLGWTGQGWPVKSTSRQCDRFSPRRNHNVSAEL